MESATDLPQTVLHRTRLAYERSRLRRAALGFSPVLLLAALAYSTGTRSLWSLLFGLILFGIGTSVLWYGRTLRKAVLPALGAGMAPLLLVLCAMHVGHWCTGTDCTTLCMHACIAGGLIAGLCVARVGGRQGGGLLFWASSSAIALCTAAMACACLGLSGLAGLAGGYGVGLLPAIAAAHRRSSSSSR
jgi:hypothetical protein